MKERRINRNRFFHPLLNKTDGIVRGMMGQGKASNQELREALGVMSAWATVSHLRFSRIKPLMQWSSWRLNQCSDVHCQCYKRTHNMLNPTPTYICFKSPRKQTFHSAQMLTRCQKLIKFVIRFFTVSVRNIRTLPTFVQNVVEKCLEK